jgi:hypothetical protein
VSSKRDSVSPLIKGALIYCSLAAGLVCASLIVTATDSHFIAFLAFIIASIAYPFIGALVVPICEEFKRWAYIDEAKQWTRNERAFYGSVWPFTLIVCGILYTYTGIINRIY